MPNGKNTLGIEFHEVGFIPPFWESFWKQRKKPGWRRSSNCVQNSFFRLSQSGRNEKTPFGSNSTRSVSYDHFGWAFPSNAKSRVDEGRPIAFKTRFFDFPHRGKTKKHPWIEFNEFVIISPFWEGFTKERKTPGWRKTSNCVENSFFRVSPYGRNEKTPFGSNSTRSVSYHHFGRAFGSSEKSRVDEGRPIAFKTRFVDFPNRGETKNHPLDRIPRGRFHTTILGGLFPATQKAGLTKVVQLRSKLVFSIFPIGAKRKNTLGSNSTSSLSYHHFGRALPRSGKRRVHEKRPIALKTRFFEFHHMGETKKHPLDRIPRGRFDTTILGWLFPAAQKAGLTKVVQLRSKLAFWTFPIEVKRKNTLGIEFHEVGFIPPFWVGFSKQRETPIWRRSSNCVENSVFRLSPLGRNEETPFGSNYTRSVSYHHFRWAFPSSAKLRVDEGRPIAFKTRFVEIPHRGETKQHPWDRIPRGRFHTTILGGLYQAAENAGLTNVVQLRSKLVFSTFPIRAKRKSTLGIEFHQVGFIPPFWVGFTKQRKTPGWRSSSNWVENSFCRVFPSGRKKKNTLGIEFHEVGFIPTFLLGPCKQCKKAGRRRSSICLENSFFRLSPSERNEKTPLGSNSTRSVSYHHFGLVLPSRGKRRVDEGRPIAFKTRFFDFPHRGETKKHPWDRFPRGRFHTTIFGGLYEAAENAGMTKSFQLGWKLVFSTFPIGAKRKNTLGIEFHEVGFIPPFWVGLTKQRKRPGWRRSSSWVENSFCRVPPSGGNKKKPLGSNSMRSVSYHHFFWAFACSAKSRVDEGRPIALKTRFVEFPHRGETKKHPWVRIPRGRFHTTIFAGLYQAAENAGLRKVVQLRSKLVLSSFPIGAKRKNTLGFEFHDVGFIPLFLLGFTKQRKTLGWRRSSNCVQNSFCRVSPSVRNEKTPLRSNSTRSVSYHHFGRDLPRSGKRLVDEGRPIAFKTRFFEFPHMGESKKHPLDRIPRGRFHTTIFGGLFPATQKAGLTKVVQLRSKLVFSTFPIGAKRKNTLGFEFHEVGFIPLFLLGFTKQRKTPGWRRSSNCVQNSFCRVSPSGRNEKTPLWSNSTRSVSYHHFGWDFPSSAKRRFDQGRPIWLKTRFVEFPHRDGSKKHPWDQIPRGRFHTTIFAGLLQAVQKGGLTNVVQLRWKLVFSSFPIGAKRKNTLWIEFHEVGFIPPFWVGFSQQRKTPGWRRSSNCVQNSFFRLSPSGQNEKTPLGSNSTRSVSYHHFGVNLPSNGKRWVDDGRPIAFKTLFFEIPHRGGTKKHPLDRIPRV